MRRIKPAMRNDSVPKSSRDFAKRLPDEEISGQDRHIGTPTFASSPAEYPTTLAPEPSTTINTTLLRMAPKIAKTRATE